MIGPNERQYYCCSVSDPLCNVLLWSPERCTVVLWVIPCAVSCCDLLSSVLYCCSVSDPLCSVLLWFPEQCTVLLFCEWSPVQCPVVISWAVYCRSVNDIGLFNLQWHEHQGMGSEDHDLPAFLCGTQGWSEFSAGECSLPFTFSLTSLKLYSFSSTQSGTLKCHKYIIKRQLGSAGHTTMELLVEWKS